MALLEFRGQPSAGLFYILLFERSKPEPAAHGCIFLPLFDFRKHILVFDRAEHAP